MHLESTGQQSAPGLANRGIGVRSDSAPGNGTPCGQVDKTETLTLRPGTSLANRMFKSVRMDLKVSGNAIVLVTLTGGANTHTYSLQTGTSITQAQKAESDYDETAPYRRRPPTSTTPTPAQPPTVRARTAVATTTVNG